MKHKPATILERIFPIEDSRGHLDEDGFIETSKDSRTKLLRVGGSPQRFIWLKKDKFSSIIQ